jgi:MFS transporter, NNP family, nitrate/nitrite transporter
METGEGMDRTDNRTLVKGTPRDGLIGATLGFFVGFAAVALFGPTTNILNKTLQLAPVVVGFLVAMPSLSGSLLRIPFAAWVDTTGGRRPFLILLGLSIGGMACLTVLLSVVPASQMTQSIVPVLFLLGILCGCGIATFSVGTAQVSYWFPRARQGSALGTYAGVGNLAPGIFSFLLPVALLKLGLGGSYLVWLIFLIVGTALYYVLGRNSPYFQLMAAGKSAYQARGEAAKLGQELFPTGMVKDSLIRSARAAKTWLLVGIYFTTFGGFLALTAWLPVYWHAFFNIDTLRAGALTALYSILASLSRVGGGALSDRLGGRTTVLLAILVTGAGAVLLALSHSFGLSVLAEVVMAMGMGVSNAAVFKLAPQAVPEAMGGVSGWVGGLGAFGGFVIPPVLGAIAAAQGQPGYSHGFIIFIGLAALSLVLALLFRQAPAAAAQSQTVARRGGM